jgi:hypothetical protein
VRRRLLLKPAETHLSKDHDRQQENGGRRVRPVDRGLGTIRPAAGGVHRGTDGAGQGGEGGHVEDGKGAAWESGGEEVRSEKEARICLFLDRLYNLDGL